VHCAGGTFPLAEGEHAVDGYSIIEFINSLGFAEETLVDLIGLPAVGVPGTSRPM